MRGSIQSRRDSFVELLNHAGQISAEQAKMKAELEYGRYRVFVDSQPRLVDVDFEQAAAELKKLPKPKKQ